MADGEVAAFQQAWTLCTGLVPLMVTKAVWDLGVPDILAAAQHDDQPALSALQIVERLDTTIKLERPPREAAEQLDRLLRCLCAYGVLKPHRHNDDGLNEKHVTNHHVAAAALPAPTYELTPLSRMLSTGAPFFLLMANPTMARPFEYLSQYIVKGTPPFGAANAGMDMWELAAARPEFNALFNAGMSFASDVSLSAFLDHYPGLPGHNVRTLVDVGGGVGTTASRIVARHPSIKAINFDLPHVVAHAPRYPGVEHIGGDMFHDVPKGDVIFMKWLLHDWDDEKCIKILKNCHKALPKYGKIIIMDAVLHATFEKEHRFNEWGLAALDILMMAHTNDGKERTRQEFEYLLHASNFSINEVYELPCPQCVIEASPF